MSQEDIEKEFAFDVFSIFDYYGEEVLRWSHCEPFI